MRARAPYCAQTQYFRHADLPVDRWKIVLGPLVLARYLKHPAS